MKPASCLLAALSALLLGIPAEGTASTRLSKIQHAVDTARSPDGSPASLRKHLVEIQPGEFVAVRGKRERRQVRYARWVESLTDDRRDIFFGHGAPSYRYYESAAGLRTEIWVYPNQHVRYVFKKDALAETHRY